MLCLSQPVEMMPNHSCDAIIVPRNPVAFRITTEAHLAKISSHDHARTAGNTRLSGVPQTPGAARRRGPEVQRMQASIPHSQRDSDPAGAGSDDRRTLIRLGYPRAQCRASERCPFWGKGPDSRNNTHSACGKRGIFPPHFRNFLQILETARLDFPANQKAAKLGLLAKVSATLCVPRGSNDHKLPGGRHKVETSSATELLATL